MVSGKQKTNKLVGQLQKIPFFFSLFHLFDMCIVWLSTRAHTHVRLHTKMLNKLYNKYNKRIYIYCFSASHASSKHRVYLKCLNQCLDDRTYRECRTDLVEIVFVAIKLFKFENVHNHPSHHHTLELIFSHFHFISAFQMHSYTAKYT